jgi:hypothetical protein
MTRRLIALLLPFLFLLAAAAGCARKEPATGCHADSQCPADSRCLSTVCTTGTRPSASIRSLGVVPAYALVQLDGTASSDADGDLVEYAWTARAVSAACAPPEVTSRTSLVPVRFGCPGKFEIGLTVRDTLGLESDAAVAEVVVAPSTGNPSVLASEDAVTDHVCGWTPFTCRTADVVQLSSLATQGLSLRWTVTPPADRPLDETRAVTFLPSPMVADPVVEIATNGSAISGDYVFRVEALDAYGVVGAAVTRVSVRNRPPVVTLTAAAAYPHAFDASRSAFRASGALAWSVEDPDGDDVDVTGTWRHVGDGTDAVFDGDFTGTGVWFSVQVPYAAPADALRLRGGAGLSRRIEPRAIDPNGGSGRAQSEVAIGNRPPVPAGGTIDLAVPHRFDAARSAYVAAVRAGQYIDPDGDPIFGGTTTGPCGTAWVEGNDAFVECAAPYQGVPAADRLVGTRTYTVAVRDPWDVGPEQPVRSVNILNSPPLLSGSPVPATRCMFRLRIIGADWYFVRPALFDVAPSAMDPDGDPIRLDPSILAATGASVTPASAICSGSDCPTFQYFEPNLTNPVWYVRSGLAATDGSATTTIPTSPAWALAAACP